MRVGGCRECVRVEVFLRVGKWKVGEWVRGGGLK